MSALNFFAKVYTDRKFHFTSFRVVIFEAKLVRPLAGRKTAIGVILALTSVIDLLSASLMIA